MNILVTGGAGYIGSVMTRVLLDLGHSVVVLDNLSHGHRHAVDSRAVFEQADLGSEDAVEEVFAKHPIDAVIHFAGVISMAESMKDPGKYFTINTCYSRLLFDVMMKHHVKQVIFSSTAGVYGNPTTIPIPEDHPKKPTNPYGESKLIVEEMLSWYDRIHSLRSVCLRYFNAAGATFDKSLGEEHTDESHIIPLAIGALRQGGSFTLFGDDYDTKDGTCVRDYIHVEDLAAAHLKALSYLQNGGKTDVFNVGTGTGYSNREVLAMIEKVSGKPINIEIKDRRPGDAHELVADASKIKTTLGWKPECSDLETIVKTAWEFHTK